MQRTIPATTNGEIPTVGNDAIEILENDHDTIEMLLNELVDGSEAQRAGALEQLKTLLTVHNATEENLIYPAIHEIAARPMHAGKLYHEQDDAKVVVWKLSMLEPGSEDFRATAVNLREAVLKHVRLEEEHEFPHLRDAAAEKMTTLTTEVRRFRGTFGILRPPSA